MTCSSLFCSPVQFLPAGPLTSSTIYALYTYARYAPTLPLAMRAMRQKPGPLPLAASEAFAHPEKTEDEG